MDIGKAFSFVLDDDDKIMKLFIGAIVAIIPIVNFAGLGYVVQLVRNVRDDEEPPMPTWENFGDYFMDGLKVFVGVMIYSIPLLLLICAYVAVAFGVESAVNSSEVESVMAIMGVCLTCFSVLFGFIPYIVFPALIARFAETDEMASMWRFGEIWSFIQLDIGSYVIVLVIAFVATSIIAPLGLIACGVGIFVTQWWSYLVIGHLSGQLARNNAALA